MFPVCTTIDSDEGIEGNLFDLQPSFQPCALLLQSAFPSPHRVACYCSVTSVGSIYIYMYRHTASILCNGGSHASKVAH